MTKPTDPSPTPWDFSTWGYYCDHCERFLGSGDELHVQTHEGNTCSFQHISCGQTIRYIGYDHNVSAAYNKMLDDKLLERMQTPEARARMKAAFNATPEELGEAAVRAAKPPLGGATLGTDERRAEEIVEAITRYVEGRKRIPRAWLDELAEVYGEPKDNS